MLIEERGVKKFATWISIVAAIVIAGLLFLGTAQASSNPLTPGFQEEVSVVGADTATAVLLSEDAENLYYAYDSFQVSDDTTGNSEVLQPEKVEGFYAVVPLKTVYIYDGTDVVTTYEF